MNKSRFTAEQKLKILQEKEVLKISIEELCFRNGISQPTYYNWKRELKHLITTQSTETDPDDLKTENKTLRKLYIDLSEHNYQLAQFLSK